MALSESPNGTLSRASGLQQLRSYNRQVILQALRQGGSLSRAELARASGLTPQAIANIVDQLIELGFVREAGRRKAQRGQPPIQIEIATDGAYGIGLRADSKRFSVATMDLGGSVRHQEGGLTPDTDKRGLVSFFSDLISKTPFDLDRCLGIGLVVPGPFDVHWPNVPSPGALAAFQRKRFVQSIGYRTGLDVFLENDATAAALGEKLQGVARDLKNYFYVFIGEGVGGGLVLNGEPYQGDSGNAGEFGHLVIDPKGPPCYCGNRGCLGQYLSLGSLTRFIAGARKGKSGQSLQNVRRRLTENWLDRAAEVLSIALVGIENLFDPEAVILGGSAPIEILNGLFGRLRDLRPSIRLGRPGERIRVSSLREQSAAVGAAALPIFAATNPSRFY